MEKLVRRHSRPVEGRGEQDIEIEQGKWRDQEIRLVHITEFHRFYALSSQDRDSGQYHPKQHDDCQCSEIFWHQNSPLLHPDIQCSPVTRTKQLRRGIASVHLNRTRLDTNDTNSRTVRPSFTGIVAL